MALPRRCFNTPVPASDWLCWPCWPCSWLLPRTKSDTPKRCSLWDRQLLLHMEFRFNEPPTSFLLRSWCWLCLCATYRGRGCGVVVVERGRASRAEEAPLHGAGCEAASRHRRWIRAGHAEEPEMRGAAFVINKKTPVLVNCPSREGLCYVLHGERGERGVDDMSMAWLLQRPSMLGPAATGMQLDSRVNCGLAFSTQHDRHHTTGYYV